MRALAPLSLFAVGAMARVGQNLEPPHPAPAWVARYSTAASGPEQVTVNFGASPDALTVGWATPRNATATTAVRWGTSPGVYPTTNENGNTTEYNFSSDYLSPTLHHVWLTGLPLNTTIYFRVGDEATGLSGEFNVTTTVIADVGESADAEATIAAVLAQSAAYQQVVLAGDICYATGCEAQGCTTWDAWQRMVQPLAAFHPFHINIGNHEVHNHCRTLTDGQPPPCLASY
jgi:hypothetical protein